MHSLRRRSLLLVISLLALASAAWFVTTRVRFASGFTARYYPGTRAAGTAAITTIEDAVATAGVRRTWRSEEPFSVSWDAFLLLNHSGPYRFSVLSDGDARLLIDGTLAFESGGPDGNVQFTKEIALDRGVHRLRLEYTPARSINIALLWAPRTIDHLSPLTGRAVWPRTPSTSQATLASVVERVRAVVVVIWCVGYLAILIWHVIAPAARAFVRHHLKFPVPPQVIALLIAVAALYATAMTWGVPGPGWAADEIVPADLIDAVSRHFSNGWWSKYPPLHFVICAVVSAPLLVWRWLDPVAFGASIAPDVMVLLFRGLTIAMAVGVVFFVYVCGSYLYDAWSAFVAAALAALTMPMVYYGKLANVDVPYVFWFSVSLACFIKIAANPSAIDYILFALTAAFAICTKDQAYGLYLLPVIAVCALEFGRPPRRRELLIAAAVGVAAFVVCDNLVFGWQSFLAHLRFITSPGAQPFRMFPATVAGHWGLLRGVWTVSRVSWGWPAFLLCVSGVVLSLWRPDRASRRLWWLLLPAISYHFTFTGVVGYTYDRFLLPLFVVLALGGGLAASVFERRTARGERVEPRAQARPSTGSGRAIQLAARLAVVAVLAYSVVYVSVVNVALLRDARYDAEQWIAANIPPGKTIGVIGSPEHAPRIEGWYTEFVDPTPEIIRLLGFDYLVVNADWAEERYGPDRLQRKGVEQLRAGQTQFQQVFESRRTISFAGMALLTRLEPFGETGYSILTKLNPTTVVFKRVPRRP